MVLIYLCGFVIFLAASHTIRLPLGYHSVTTLNLTAGGQCLAMYDFYSFPFPLALLASVHVVCVVIIPSLLCARGVVRAQMLLDYVVSVVEHKLTLLMYAKKNRHEGDFFYNYHSSLL